MLNRVVLMGRITNDLEVKQTQSGLSVLRFNVAVDRPAKQGAEKQTDFISCTAFGQRAEFIGRYFGKGRMIAIEGNLKTGSYDKNGITVYTTDVWVDSVSFTGEKRQDEGLQPSYRQPVSEHDKQIEQQYQADKRQSAAPMVTGTDDYEDIISDEGLPF